jgi:hypothetical protein
VKRAAIFLAVAAALTIPTGVAIAQGPGTHGRSAPKVNYILRGTLSGYTAVQGTTSGQITILVKHSNYHARALRNQQVTFTLVAGKSRVTFMRGSHAHGQIVDGTKGYITARAPRKITGDLVTELPNQATRIHVVVLKAPTPPTP